MNKKKILYVAIIGILGISLFYGSYKYSRYHFNENVGEKKIPQYMEKLEDMYFDEFDTDYLEELDKMSKESEKEIEVMSKDYLMNRTNSSLRSISCSGFEDCSEIKDRINRAADTIMRTAKKNFESNYSEPRNVEDGFFVDLEIKGLNMDMLVYDITEMAKLDLEERIGEEKLSQMTTPEGNYEFSKSKADVMEYMVNNKLDNYLTNDVKGTIYWEKDGDDYLLEGITVYYVYLSGSKDETYVPVFTDGESFEEMSQIYVDYENNNLKRAQELYEEFKKRLEYLFFLFMKKVVCV